MIGALIIALLWALFKTKNNIVRVVIVLFFIIWQGVPAFNIWRADKLVDELCAKDGGVKVYETVTLPKERFNAYGQFEVWSRRNMEKNDEYFMQYETKLIKGKYDDQGFLPKVDRNNFYIIRLADNKKMGEVIYYRRSRGDPVGPWMGSAYSCPKDWKLEEKIFLMSTNKSAN